MLGQNRAMEQANGGEETEATGVQKWWITKVGVKGSCVEDSNSGMDGSTRMKKRETIELILVSSQKGLMSWGIILTLCWLNEVFKKDIGWS